MDLVTAFFKMSKQGLKNILEKFILETQTFQVYRMKNLNTCLIWGEPILKEKMQNEK